MVVVIMVTRRKQQGAYLTKRLDDFSGGWSTEHPVSLAESALAKAKNVMLTLAGKVAPRWGMAKRFAADFSTSPVLGMGALRKSDGTTRLVVAAGTALYSDKPHIEFLYDAQADWEQVGAYTNLDTKSAPGDVKMYTPPQASFLGTPTYDKVWV